jgi:hypothetical protein
MRKRTPTTTVVETRIEHDWSQSDYYAEVHEQAGKTVYRIHAAPDPEFSLPTQSGHELPCSSLDMTRQRNAISIRGRSSSDDFSLPSARSAPASQNVRRMPISKRSSPLLPQFLFAAVHVGRFRKLLLICIFR